jgi:hypothetical protein
MTKIEKSEALKATLKNLKDKTVPYNRNYKVFENGVVLNTRTGYATDGNITGTTNYPKISIYVEGKTKVIEVHKLVANAFKKGNWKINRHKEVNHKDGDKTNNNVSNIELVTRKQNIRHAIDVLGKRFGRVTNDEVYEIRTRFNTYVNPKVGIKNLAKRYNISENAVSNIVNNVTYTNV